MTPEKLCELAREAMTHAYVPYSGYQVGAALLCADGTVYQVWQDAQVKPYLTRNRVTYQDLLPGTRVLVWADDEGQTSKVIVFPYEYKGSVSLDGYGRLYVSGVAV